MELHSFNWELLMAHSHYLVVVERARSNLELVRQALLFGNERVVPCRREWIFDILEYSPAIMSDWASLSMAQLLGMDYLASEGVDNALVTKTNA